MRSPLHVDEGEPAESLRQTRDDGPVTLRVVIQLEEWRGHQLVVPGYRKQRWEKHTSALVYVLMVN